MKDITLKITSKQNMGDHEEEQMEFVTDGKFYTRNGAGYIVYDETEMSGLMGCKTVIKLKDQSVKMKRDGEVGFNTELQFEEGKRYSSIYETPYGAIGLEVFTKTVDNNLDMEKGEGIIDVLYQISIEGVAEGENRITIKVN